MYCSVEIKWNRRLKKIPLLFGKINQDEGQFYLLAAVRQFEFCGAV